MLRADKPLSCLLLIALMCSAAPATDAHARQSTKAQAQPSYQVTPGKGVRSKDVVTVYNDTGLTYGMTGAKMRTDIWILLDNGWAVKNPGLPVGLIDADAHRKAKPKSWVKWKKVSGKPSRQNSKGEWEAFDGSSYPTAKRGQRIAGFYTFYSSGSMGGASWSGKDWIRFRKDGTFQTGKSSMMASSGVMGSSAYSARSQGPDGCSSATSVSGGVVGGSSRNDPSCGDGRSGTYEIDGLMVTLSANDGQVRHVPFYMARNTETFVFDGKYYAQEKDPGI